MYSTKRSQNGDLSPPMLPHASQAVWPRGEALGEISKFNGAISLHYEAVHSRGKCNRQ